MGSGRRGQEERGLSIVERCPPLPPELLFSAARAPRARPCSQTVWPEDHFPDFTAVERGGKNPTPRVCHMCKYGSFEI